MTDVARPPRLGAAAGERTDRRQRVPPRGWRRIGYAALVLLAYVPVLLTAPGKVAADTKQYLYLDPSRMLGRAASMWDPNIGMGTVTHQNIGYLFPMGPFYWVFDKVAVPDWIAQRLWLGTILLAAGLGTIYLLRTLGMRGTAVAVGALAYMLSPYSLDYAARISVILLPWAGLPWMLAFTVRALRGGGWRYPALFAIVVQIVGGVNATALVYAGIGPVLWIPYSIWITREIPWRRAVATTAKVGGLTLVTSLWWMSGLWAQGSYGLDVLKYTETVQTVAKTSLAPEVLRGLGYWFFYGQDKLGPWIEAATNYTQWIWLILLSYLIPSLALLSAAFVRWRHRAFFVVLALVGVAMAVGPSPYDTPSPLGSVFKAFATGSTAGLALRSTARAVPLVALGLAVLLAAGVDAIVRNLAGRGLPRHGIAVACVVGALVVLNLPALWNGSFYGSNLERPEAIPKYWQDAIHYVDSHPHSTRILELPGSDFASYRWGNTVDPITPGLTDRPYVARELIPYGSPPSADLLNAFDRQLQEGLLEPQAIAPIARLMSAGDVLLRYDLQTDRYNLVRPQSLARLFRPTPGGLTGPTDFGTKIPGKAKYPQLDEQALAAAPPMPARPRQPAPPPVAVYGVSGAPKIVRAQPESAPTIVSGDGEGLVDAASVGLVDGNGLVLYSASYARDAGALRSAIDHDSSLVITDTNRAQARRWSTVRDNLGYTEAAGEKPLVTDPADARLDVFPGAAANASTTAEPRGVKSVQASHYGNPVSYTPEDRPERALDGDLYTAWKVGAFAPVNGERIRVVLDRPVTTDHVNLVQPLYGPRGRYITRATFTFDGGHPVSRPLGPASRTPGGETLTFPKQTFSTFELRIDDTNTGALVNYAGASAVGLSELRLRDDAPGATDVRVDEVVQMPTDLLDAAGAASEGHPLSYVMTRERTLPVPPRYDPELALARELSVPTERAFAVSGEARIDPLAPDDTLDRLLGAPGPSEGGVVATSSEHLPGDARARASAAIDGDPATAWSTPFAGVTGQWVDYRLPAPIAFDHMELQLVADGRHSVPTQLQVDAGGQTRRVDIPPVSDQGAPNATVSVPLRFAPLTGNDVKVTITAIRPETTLEYFSAAPIVMPAAIAELGVPGLRQPAGPDTFDSGCRSDLVSVDGKPLPVRVTGDRSTAEASGALPITACGASPAPSVTLGRGDHLLRSAKGMTTGVDVDRLVLSSGPGGVAASPSPPAPTPAASTGAPSVTVTKSGRTAMTVRVDHATRPFYLVLGQSQNAGWVAKVGGHGLGESRVVNGYANGWLVTPKQGQSTLSVSLTWTPQRVVWASLAVSLLAFLACAAIVLVSWTRHRRRRGGPRTFWRANSPRNSGIRAPEAVWGQAEVDAEPEVANPLVATGVTPHVAGVVGATVVAAVVAGALVRPWAGVLVGALVLLVLLRPRWRAVLSLSPAVALGLCGLFIAAKQLKDRFPPVFEWPTNFWQVRTLGWLAIVLLAADILVELVRTARPGRAGRDASPM